ncbi:MAG: WYL domain-containing protein [Clostridia bacterium]|nr:WYL domain-containing protein [Clostridia bacterium]
MAKQANQKLKLLLLRDILRRETDEQHPITLEQMRELLAAQGVSAERKSLYDDLEQLRLLGEDVVTVRDRSVRYYIGQREFDLPQLRLLVDAVQSSKFITRRKSEQLIRQLEGLTSRHMAGQLQRQVLVSGRIKNMNESIYYNVDSLQAAIADNRQVEFRYFDWGADKKQHLRREGAAYTVSPWALTWDDENYYLIAYEEASDSIRHYRVDRMLRITVIHQPRQGEALFRQQDMAVYSRKTFGMFGGEAQVVTLRCADRMAGVVLDRFGQETTLFPQEDGHFTVRVPVAVSPQFFAWVTGLDNEVHITAPAAVVEEYRQYLASILQTMDEVTT